ncbi:hypothetical protein NO1_0846 [Candidatus Termititenax aidoneus]|uniref:Uncharacterized protein n=1 Tax=Termititenax aidoneus TaxID=2218524 RepID=A0A388TAJ7_TERA1|nr:hypothetical protein NO1_0846 [Candidatus Termititenax aidoneus]
MSDVLTIESGQQARRMIVESINKALAGQPPRSKDSVSLSGQAKHIDYEISYLLSVAENKQEFCRNILDDLQNLKRGKKDIALEDFFAKLKFYILGKIFYLALQDSRYLLIENFSSRANRNFFIRSVQLIERSQDDAVLLLDSLDDPALRDFFTGIISCVYN